MEQIVKIKGKPYIVSVSARGYWHCPQLEISVSFSRENWEQNKESAFQELVKQMREKANRG